MEGLTPVQISELVTLLEDAISTRTTPPDLGLRSDQALDPVMVKNEIDHLEAELAWIQWMRENHQDHEIGGFPADEVDSHIQGMAAGIENWQARRRDGAEDGDVNYIQSLESSIQIVTRILEFYAQIHG